MIGAFILSVGQETEDKCFMNVYNQIDRYKIIKNVSPVNKAINQCFKKAEYYKLDYFIILGADTIHYENSINTMMKYMTDDMWCVMGRLDDYFRGNDNYGNHLYNAKAMKGYRVDENDSMYDHKVHVDMEERGYKKVITKEIIGRHHPIWTPEEAFCKHYFSGMRYDEKYRKKFFAQVVSKNAKENSPVTEAAKLGFLEGMKSKEKTLLTKKTPKAWFKYKNQFNINDKLVW